MFTLQNQYLSLFTNNAVYTIFIQIDTTINLSIFYILKKNLI